MKNQDTSLIQENEMKSERWDIIAKHLNNEVLTAEEKIILETATTDKELQNDLKEASAVTEKTDRYFQLKKYDTNRAWEKVSQQLDQKKRVIPMVQTLLRIAAVFVLVSATAFGVWHYSSQMGYNEYTTTASDLSRPEIVLPDGSKVTLSHGSALKVPKKFNQTTREVELTGEAFFNVTPNPEKPFIIATEKASVKVLGTSFNVYAYRYEPIVEVIVKTGKVQFFENQKTQTTSKNSVILMPGEEAVYYKSEQRIQKSTTVNKNAFSWITGEISFEFTPLSEVISTLQRIYNVEIKLDENIEPDQKINATFNKQEVDYILEIVAQTLDLQLIANTQTTFSLSKN